MSGSALRKLIVERAGNRCEYCHMHQEDEPYYRFHVEHVIARQHGGSSGSDNLALACHHFNSYKGPNLTTVVPGSHSVIRLFNPRLQAWARHFKLGNGVVMGRTKIGRATVRLLNMHAVARVALRLEVTRSSANPKS